MTVTDRCDEAAATLARAYMMSGIPAFVLRVNASGEVSIIGPHLDPEIVAQMLRTAADAYQKQAKRKTLQ